MDPAPVNIAAVAHLLPAAVLVLDREGVVVEANRDALVALERPRDEVIGRPFAQLVAGDPAQLGQYLRLCARSREMLPGAFRVRADGPRLRCDAARLDAIDGTARIFVRVRPPHDIQSFPLLAQKIRDLNDEIRRRREVQAILARTQALTAALAASRTLDQVAAVTIQQAVPALRADGGALLIIDDDEPAARRLRIVDHHGYDPELIRAIGGSVAFDADLPAAEAVRARAPVFVSSSVDDPRYPAARAYRGWPAAIAAAPLVSHAECYGALVFSFDRPRSLSQDERELLLTLATQCAVAIERIHLFERERRAGISAATAERRKDEFLAMLGHELRNPLAPIVTALELMRYRDDKTFARERSIIERQTRHLASLVDDLLDVSRITRGKITLRREARELASAVERAIEMTSPLLEQRAIRLAVEVPRDGLTIEADHDRIAQVIANLLNNAAKYTDAGGEVSLRAFVDGDEAVVEVTDSGIGIAPELLADLFEPFVQGRQAVDRARGGLGLGLAIVRSLVELHGGAVFAHSDGAGRGSRFVARLPGVRRATAGPGTSGEVTPAPAPAERAAARVLVVDDNVDAAYVLAATLELQGYATRVAVDGPSALREAAAFAPHAALLDLGLPVMDGFELAARLRGLPHLRDLVLIAVTGYGLERDRERTRAVGFDDHLVKPVHLEELSSRLEALLTHAADSAGSADRARPETPAGGMVSTEG